METYTGVLKTEVQASQWADTLEAAAAVATPGRRVVYQAAARMLRQGWRAIAARPIRTLDFVRVTKEAGVVLADRN